MLGKSTEPFVNLTLSCPYMQAQRLIVNLTEKYIPHDLNIRHIKPDMADTYKLILDISLVYLTRG